MVPARKRISAVEWSQRPETNRIEELIEGEVFLVPEPTTSHQDAVGNIFFALTEWARRTEAGRVFVAPTGVRLAWDTVVQPDVLFVAAARAEIICDEGIFGAPDLVVEVLSPSTAARDRGDKLRLYERNGVSEYWIADTQARRIERYELADRGLVLARQFLDGEILESVNLPGFALPIAVAFRR
ncbi:MAG: Uma2 family endonuclease [Myxococcales bacterium]|nr:Uma2 family endonuclease [Myxococcales bacterium]